MPKRITERDIQKMREMIAQGVARKDIAYRLGCHVNTVSIYSSDESFKRYVEREKKKWKNRADDPEHRQRQREWQRQWEARQRAIPRSGDPPQHQAIKTAVPILRKLFRHMYENRIKQRDVAEAANVGENTIKAWKKGKAEPTLANLEALCDSLGFELTLTPKSRGDTVAELATESNNAQR